MKDSGFMNNLVVHKNHTDFVPGTGNVTAKWEGRTSELNGGIRKYWGGESMMRPYIGGSLAFIGAWLEAQTGRFDYVRDSDYGVGSNTQSRWFSLRPDPRFSLVEVSSAGLHENGVRSRLILYKC